MTTMTTAGATSRPNVPATGDKRRDEGRIERNARRGGGKDVEGDDGDDLLVIVPRGFHYTRGDEGAGPPQSSTMTGGAGWHIHASRSCDVVDGGWGEAHTPPPSNSSPPITPAPAISKGGGVQPTRRPPLFQSIYPCLGGFFFSAGVL